MRNKTLKNILTGIGFTALTLISLNEKAYPQKVNCDTIYNNEKEIERIICRKEGYSGTFSIYISDFKDREIFSRSELLYGKAGRLMLNKKFEKDEEGRTLIRWDNNGNGYIDETWRWDNEEEITEIDKDNDGFFEIKSTGEYFPAKFDAFLNPSFDEDYEITYPSDTSMGHGIKIDSISQIKKPDYQGKLENVVLAFIDIQKGEKKTKVMINLDDYNLSYEFENINIMDLFMGTREKGFDFDPPIRLYIVEKSPEGRMNVIPTIIKNGYDFSDDKPKKIKKQAKDLLSVLGEENVSVSDPAKLGSAEMIFELIGKNKRKKEKKKK